MSILNSAFGLIPNKQVEQSTFSKNDFAEGLEIIEIINGTEDLENKLSLVGSFMPKDNFTHSGVQNVIKENYAGSKYPSVQILGSKEDDVTINGQFNENNLRDKSLKGAAVEFEKKINELRVKGSVVKVKLGDYWTKYCVIGSVKFSMIHLEKINYEVRFVVLGNSLPKNYYFVDGQDVDISSPNNQLIKATVEHQKLLISKPTEVPRGISDIIQSGVNQVASAIGAVTGFVDSILDDAEKINSSAQRALSLIKYARSYIAKTNRRIGSIKYNFSSITKESKSESKKASSGLNNISYVQSILKSNKELNKNLATLQKVFESKTSKSPLVLHLVNEGDSLQKISIKYYGTPDNWNKIMSHNRLRTSVLKVGSKLLIPK